MKVPTIKHLPFKITEVREFAYEMEIIGHRTTYSGYPEDKLMIARRLAPADIKEYIRKGILKDIQRIGLRLLDHTIYYIEWSDDPSLNGYFYIQPD